MGRLNYFCLALTVSSSLRITGDHKRTIDSSEGKKIWLYLHIAEIKQANDKICPSELQMCHKGADGHTGVRGLGIKPSLVLEGSRKTTHKSRKPKPKVTPAQ